jgi:hypothetical protein
MLEIFDLKNAFLLDFTFFKKIKFNTFTVNDCFF